MPPSITDLKYLAPIFKKKVSLLVSYLLSTDFLYICQGPRFILRVHVQRLIFPTPLLNPTERSAAATKRSTSQSALESLVESHRALAEHSTDLLGHCSLSARWDSTDDSKPLSPVERSVAAAEHSVGVVVQSSYDYGNLGSELNSRR